MPAASKAWRTASKSVGEAITSIVLEDMVSWMKIKIPVNVTDDEKKKKICWIAINTLIEKIRTELKNYNSIELIKK